MKKVILIILSALFINGLAVAQDSSKPESRKDDFMDLNESLKKMQEQMMKFFGNGQDSMEGFSFKMDTSMMRMDTSMSKSFGFMFDGNDWKSLTPNTEGGDMSGMLKQLQERMQKMMPDMNRNFDMSKMFEGFGNMFGESDENSMPLVKPKDKNAEKNEKNADEYKNKKYKTEKL